MRFVRATSAVALFLGASTIAFSYAQQDQGNGKQDKSERPEGRQEQGGQERRGQQRQQQVAAPPARQQRPQQQQQRPQAREQRQQQQSQRATQPMQQRRQQTQTQQQAQPQRPPQQQAQRPTQEQARQQQQPRRTEQQATEWQRQRGWVQQGAWREHSTWQQGRAQRWESEHRTWAQRGGYGGYYIPQAAFGLSFGNQHWFRMRNRPTMYMGYPRFSYGGFSFLLLDPWPEYWAEDWYATDDTYIDYYDDGYYLYNRRYPSVRLAITVVL